MREAKWAWLGAKTKAAISRHIVTKFEASSYSKRRVIDVRTDRRAEKRAEA